MADKKEKKLSRTMNSVMPFTRRMLKKGLGFSPEGMKKVEALLKAERSQIQKHVLNVLNDEAFRYLNLGLSQKQQSGNSDESSEEVESNSPEQSPKADKKDNKDDKKDNKDDKKDDDKKPLKESFLHYLLNELSSRDIAQGEIDAMGSKKDRVNRARKSDAAMKMDRSKELDDMKKSEDPIDRQILQLRNKIAMLQKKKSGE